MSSKQCPSCGVFNQATAERCDCGQSLLGVTASSTHRRTAISGLDAAGAALMAFGVAIWVFCFAVFDVSVEVPKSSSEALKIDRVANIERLDQRQSAVTIGAALFVAGAVLFAAGTSAKRTE